MAGWVVLTTLQLVHIMTQFHYARVTMVDGDPTTKTNDQTYLIGEMFPTRVFYWATDIDWSIVLSVAPFGINLICMVVIASK